jgi:hypothetical protein
LWDFGVKGKNPYQPPFTKGRVKAFVMKLLFFLSFKKGGNITGKESYDKKEKNQPGTLPPQNVNGRCVRYCYLAIVFVPAKTIRRKHWPMANGHGNVS